MSDPNIPVMRAAEFANSIGVDTHIPYTDGGYGDASLVSSELAYLGTDHVRDQLTDGKDYFGHDNGSALIGRYIALAQQGQTFTIEIDATNATTASVDYQLGLAKELLAAVPGSVDIIEGTNEINNNTSTSFNGVKGQAGAIALQKYIYDQVHTDPVFGNVDASGKPIASTKTDIQGNPLPAGVAVAYFTGYGATGEGQGPNPVTGGLADFDNQHSYPQNQAPRFYEEPSTTLPNAADDGTIPHIYSESGGYFTGQGGVSGHDEGAYTLDLVADAAQTGSTQTDLYELGDMYGAGSSYGLFDSSGNPKPAAIGIHDLESIIKDTGATAATFTPKSVDATLSGMPSTGQSMQLAKSNGTADLMVWAEPGVGTVAPNVPVTATLDGKYDVKVFDPMLGTDAIATYTDVSTFTLGITDHPLIAELTPDAGTGSGGTTTPPVTTPPVTTDPGAGGSTTPPATGSGNGGTTTTPPVTTPPVTTDPGTGTGTTPTGGTDGGSTTPPVTTPPVTTAPSGGGDTGTSTTPPVTTPPVTTAPPADTGSTTTPPLTTDPQPVTTDPAPTHGLDPRTRALYRLDNWIQGHELPGFQHKVAAADALTAALGPDANYRATLRLLKAEDHGQDAQVDFATFEHRLGVDARAALTANVQSGLHPDA